MGFSFDSSLVEDDLIPKGQYSFVVSNVDEKTSTNGHLMLSFEFTISDGPYEGRKLFENYLVEHPTAGNFARRSLKQLSESCLHPKWEDAAELKGKSFSAEISHKEGYQGNLKEKVSKFRKIQPHKLEYKVLNVQDIPF
jgi:hypothetical protein